MDYLGPQQADFSNVRSLNLEFLGVLARRQSSALLAGLPGELSQRVRALRPAQCERLAATPFLLFSFRERDDDYWERLLAANAARDLFAGASADEGQMRLIAAGLGFVWQLARQNSYAARLICGASLHWCERLAERTLLDVVNVVAASDDVLVLREGADCALWRKLLHSGISNERQVRRAAHISALQYVLTSCRRADAPRLATAARAGLSPSLRVADETRR